MQNAKCKVQNVKSKMQSAKLVYQFLIHQNGGERVVNGVYILRAKNKKFKEKFLRKTLKKH